MSFDFPDNPIDGDVHYDEQGVAWFYQVDQWVPKPGYIGTLNQFKDVEVTNPQINDALVWSTDKYINQSQPEPELSEKNKNFPANRHFFRVHPKFSKTYTPNGVGIVPFDNVVIDTSNAFNPTTYTWTVPESGYYKLYFGVVYVTGGTARQHAYLYVDGVEKEVFISATHNSSYDYFMQNTIFVKLSQNQQVDCRYKSYTNNISGTPGHRYRLSGGTDTEFSGFLYRRE